mgnify:CR=1 FL=1
MTHNRRSTQQFLEQEQNEYIEALLQKTKQLNSVAQDISVEIRGSIDDIGNIVRQSV